MSQKDDRFQVTREVGARLRQVRLRARLMQSDLAGRFAVPRSRGEPSASAQLALDGLDRFLRRG